MVVKIFGREYPLRCNEDSARITRVAELLDNKMRQIATATSVKSHSDVAVLAALNLVHELLDSTLDAELQESDARSRAESLLAKLDEKLPDLEPA